MLTHWKRRPLFFKSINFAEVSREERKGGDSGQVENVGSIIIRIQLDT